MEEMILSLGSTQQLYVKLLSLIFTTMKEHKQGIKDHDSDLFLVPIKHFE